MAEGFSYETAITDGMSGPANAESQSLKRLQSEIGSTEKEIRKLQDLQIKYKETGFKGIAGQAGLEIQKLRLHLGDLKKDQKDLTPKDAKADGGLFGDLFSSLVPEIALGELLAEGVKKTAETAVEIVKSGVELGVEATKFAIEMSEFRENATEAFTAVLGTKEEGERAFEGFEELGKAVHLPVERAESMAQELMLQGEENVSTISNVLTAVADLNRVGLERGAEKLQSIIERSLATGAFVLPKKLAGLGVKLPDLYADLATRLHKSVPEVKALMKAGKIDVETGITALTSAITSGNIGEVAAKKLTLKDIGTDLRNDIISMFDGIDTSPLMRGLETLRMLFEDSDGSVGNFKTQVTDVFNTVVRWVGDATTEFTKLALHFEIGFLDAELAAKPIIEDFKKLSGQTDVLEILGQGAELLGSGLVKAVVGAAWLVLQIEKLRELITPALLHEPGHEVGSGFVDGFKIGITGGALGVEQVIKTLAEGAIAKARDVFGAHSPATSGIELGHDWQEGLAIGLRRGQPLTDDVMGAATPALGGKAMELPDFSGLSAPGGGAAGVVVSEGAIRVDIHVGQTTATKEDIQEITEHAMADAIERLVLELGG